jgi:GcrA cell cycle regulator
MTASAWTEDRINRLKTLWREGKTADQVARDLGPGVSRSAVLGKVYRMGLSDGRVRGAPKTTLVEPKPAIVAPTRSRPARPAEVTSPPPAEHGLATLLSVRRCECRWPFGEPGAADFSLCGRPVARGAFCGPHAAVAYRPTPETPRSLERLARLR